MAGQSSQGKGADTIRVHRGVQERIVIVDSGPLDEAGGRHIG